MCNKTTFKFIEPPLFLFLLFFSFLAVSSDLELVPRQYIELKDDKKKEQLNTQNIIQEEQKNHNLQKNITETKPIKNSKEENINEVVFNIDNQDMVITADEQVANIKDGIVVFKGNVVLSHSRLKIKADKIEVKRIKESGQEMLTSFGDPVYLYHLLENNERLEANAKEISYQRAMQKLVLKGNAKLLQDGSTVEGDLINYDIDLEQLTAKSSQENQRVTTVIQPNQFKNLEK